MPLDWPKVVEEIRLWGDAGLIEPPSGEEFADVVLARVLAATREALTKEKGS